MKKQTLLAAYRETKDQLAGLTAIARAETTDGAWEALDRLSSDLGFGYCGVGIIGRVRNEISIKLEHASTFFRNSFADFHQQDLHLSSPIAHAVAQGKKLTFASRAIASAPVHLHEGGRKLSAHLRKDSIAGHAVIRVDLPDRIFASFFSLGQRDHDDTGDFTKRVEEHYDVLNLAATAYTSVALRGLGQPNADIVTPREARVLTLLARGLTAREIAEEEGRALATIRHQIAHARHQLGATTTAQAVAIALEIGVVDR